MMQTINNNFSNENIFIARKISTDTQKKPNTRSILHNIYNQKSNTEVYRKTKILQINQANSVHKSQNFFQECDYLNKSAQLNTYILQVPDSDRLKTRNSNTQQHGSQMLLGLETETATQLAKLYQEKGQPMNQQKKQKQQYIAYVFDIEEERLKSIYTNKLEQLKNMPNYINQQFAVINQKELQNQITEFNTFDNAQNDNWVKKHTLNSKRIPWQTYYKLCNRNTKKFDCEENE